MTDENLPYGRASPQGPVGPKRKRIHQEGPRASRALGHFSVRQKPVQHYRAAKPKVKNK